MAKNKELSKRGAAAMANATRGRARVVESKKNYKRSLGKKVGHCEKA